MAKIGQWMRRKAVQLYGKIVKEKASPEYIARGWAIGMFYGCLVPFGAQLVCSIPTAFILKGSKIGAVFGTLLTNHVSIFIIYPIQCYVGSWLMGDPISFSKISDAMADVIKANSYQALLALGWNVVAAFFIGGAILTAVMTPLTYWGVKRLVVVYRKKKEMRAARRAQRSQTAK